MNIDFYDDIGMFAINRPINDHSTVEGSCVHRTEFCNQTCYNMKLYNLYPKMKGRDVKDEEQWQGISGLKVLNALSKKRKSTKRVRLMSRGEAIKDETDIPRIFDICINTPDTDWWMPTRSWRNKELRIKAEAALFPLANLAILASTDPTTSEAEQQMLEKRGWSTMFYGLDGALSTTEGTKRFKCPKTWGKVKGACMVCLNGCFKPITKGEQVHVHLKRH